jgi:mono/diheme cytochrome c family protein
MKTSWTTVGSVALALFLSGCGKEKLERAWSFMPNMHEQESVRAFEPEPTVKDVESRTGSAMRQPVSGTVPMDLNQYKLTKRDAAAAAQNNPLPRSMSILKAGQRAYNIYCIVCHGEKGKGDGNIIPNFETPGFSHSGREYNSPNHQFPPPPALDSDRIQEMSDGDLFNYITKGGMIMPKYDHLPTEMRWSVVHYLRVLYKASHATEEEVKEFEAAGSKYEDTDATSVVNDWR